MALPLIWLDRTNEPTKLERIKALMAGASHPSPRRDLVPTKTSISPF
ncbi:hypothetical protein [Riemerella anatipestifer]|nr:hypothetical protein [Riemerella anatipestifer]MCO7331607.1 hypothetical protein [Riemerella anatipestifer]MCU7582455.1 hypothetical protein [Riemerella anatipestifer]MCW0492677.1 hypothetical protein [Riemerella anatipestifer]MDR7750367.1 hypothetical protein [Riemerella anatipestifer]MDR7752505.1 hypothetical protein [Riemerella anatipestifer]